MYLAYCANFKQVKLWHLSNFDYLLCYTKFNVIALNGLKEKLIKCNFYRQETKLW